MSAAVETSREGRVLRVALNRPEHRNLITHGMATELIEHLTTDDPNIGAILLEGCGDFFCYGGDSGLPDAFWLLREHSRKPLVAAVKGAALGSGMALAASAHVVVAAQGTSFGLLEIRNKICPPGLRVVAGAIGERRATELALTGRVCSTPEALQMGLIHEAAPAFEYEARAEAIAQMLSTADAEIVRQILQFARSSP